MYLRPGLLEFLEDCSQHFELILYSNGAPHYTERVISKLIEAMTMQSAGNSLSRGEGDIDVLQKVMLIQSTKPIIKRQPVHFFEYVLNREQCSSNEKGHEIKNLDFFTGPGSNRDIGDCIIVDNSIYCYQNHLSNGLRVPNYNFSDI